MLVNPVLIYIVGAAAAAMAIAGYVWRPPVPALPAELETAFRPSLLRRQATRSHAAMLRKVVIAAGIVCLLATIGAVFVSGRALVFTGRAGEIDVTERFVFGEDELRGELRGDAPLRGDRTWIVNRSQISLVVVTEHYSRSSFFGPEDPPAPYWIPPGGQQPVPVARDRLHVGPNDKPGYYEPSSRPTDARIWVTW